MSHKNLQLNGDIGKNIIISIHDVSIYLLTIADIIIKSDGYNCDCGSKQLEHCHRVQE